MLTSNRHCQPTFTEASYRNTVAIRHKFLESQIWTLSDASNPLFLNYNSSSGLRTERGETVKQSRARLRTRRWDKCRPSPRYSLLQFLLAADVPVGQIVVSLIKARQPHTHPHSRRYGRGNAPHAPPYHPPSCAPIN